MDGQRNFNRRSDGFEAGVNGFGTAIEALQAMSSVTMYYVISILFISSTDTILKRKIISRFYIIHKKQHILENQPLIENVFFLNWLC
jgi:hypothetical protein